MPARIRRLLRGLRGPDRRGPDHRGAVTAELAVALPVLVLVTGALVWPMRVAIDQARTVDAARETARSLARGDEPATALALGHRVAPDGVSLSIDHSGDRVVVSARGRTSPPGGLFGSLIGADLEAEAVAASEESS